MEENLRPMAEIVKKIEAIYEDARRTIGYKLGSDAKELGFPLADYPADPPEPKDVLSMCNALLVIIDIAAEGYPVVVGKDIFKKIRIAFSDF